MRSLVVYSSVTGNTQLVAEGIAKALPIKTDVFPVYKAPAAAGYDLVFLGFWAYRAKPDPRMLRYMQTIYNQKVALFGTLAAWPDSSHARVVLKHARQILASNNIIGEFLCLGKLAQKRFAACMSSEYVNIRNPMTPERKARLIEGQTHPDDADIDRAADLFRHIVLQQNLTL